MADALIERSATVTCSHQGTASPTTTSTRVKASNQAIVTQTGTWTISSCTYTTAAGNPLPCVTAQWTSAATRVKSGGEAVLLETSQATTVPNGVSLTVSNTQQRVKGT
jgi:hypothetical protein